MNSWVFQTHSQFLIVSFSYNLLMNSFCENKLLTESVNFTTLHKSVSHHCPCKEHFHKYRKLPQQILGKSEPSSLPLYSMHIAQFQMEIQNAIWIWSCAVALSWMKGRQMHSINEGLTISSNLFDKKKTKAIQIVKLVISESAFKIYDLQNSTLLVNKCFRINIT